MPRHRNEEEGRDRGGRSPITDSLLGDAARRNSLAGTSRNAEAVQDGGVMLLSLRKAPGPSLEGSLLLSEGAMAG